MTSATQSLGSAERWGPLWGARPDDWALSEDQQLPSYEAALQRVPLEPGQRVLDVGCGVGAFLRLVADRGAEPFGLDASEALIDLARRRVPEADLRVGDMESLPYDADTFDLVTGFTSFFFANDMVAALREAGRVAKPGAPVVIQVWGAHEQLFPRSDEGDREAVLPAPPSRCATRPRPVPARRTGSPGDRSRPQPRNRLPSIVGLHVPRSRRRSAGRSSLQRALPSSSDQSAKKRSKPRSWKASQNTAPPTGATGSRQRVPLPDRARMSTFAVIREADPAGETEGSTSSRGWPSTQPS